MVDETHKMKGALAGKYAHLFEQQSAVESSKSPTSPRPLPKKIVRKWAPSNCFNNISPPQEDPIVSFDVKASSKSEMDSESKPTKTKKKKKNKLADRFAHLKIDPTKLKVGAKPPQRKKPKKSPNVSPAPLHEPIDPIISKPSLKKRRRRRAPRRLSLVDLSIGNESDIAFCSSMYPPPPSPVDSVTPELMEVDDDTPDGEGEKGNDDIIPSNPPNQQNKSPVSESSSKSPTQKVISKFKPTKTKMKRKLPHGFHPSKSEVDAQRKKMKRSPTKSSAPLRNPTLSKPTLSKIHRRKSSRLSVAVNIEKEVDVASTPSMYLANTVSSISTEKESNRPVPSDSVIVTMFESKLNDVQQSLKETLNQQNVTRLLKTLTADDRTVLLAVMMILGRHYYSDRSFHDVFEKALTLKRIQTRSHCTLGKDSVLRIRRWMKVRSKVFGDLSNGTSASSQKQRLVASLIDWCRLMIHKKNPGIKKLLDTEPCNPSKLERSEERDQRNPRCRKQPGRMKKRNQKAKKARA